MFGGDIELERSARVAEQRLALLVSAARAIAGAMRCDDVARIAAREACAAVGARAAVVVSSTHEVGAVSLVAAHGLGPAPFEPVTLGPDHPLARVCRTATAEWLEGGVAERAGAPFGLVPPGTNVGFVALPICAEHRAVGALGLVLHGRTGLPAPDRELLVTLVELCSQAYVRALRHDVERTERVAAARLGVMLEAGQAISRATDAAEVVVRLGDLVAPRFADWAVVDLVVAEHGPRLGAVIHAATGRVGCTYEADRERPLPAALVPRVLERVLRSGEPELFARASLELVREPEAEEEHLAAARREGVRSAIVVPLAARDAVLGTVTLVSTREGLEYDEMDLRLASKIAHHAALALDNARLIEAERAARCEAQRANRMKDAFLATISHELRTPLHAILGWATLLRGGALEGSARDRAIETIERNARAQARLVDDVLDVSRIISGKLSLELGEVELADVLLRAVDVVWPTAQAKRIELEVAVPPMLGRTRADRGRLEQVFWNVLSNAVKFTPERGRVRVEAVARVQESDVVVRISDTGKGIRPEFLDFVFEPFHQQDSSTTRGHGGLGLGLSIAHHLVRLHGGEIGVESEGDGLGATFEIRLPSSVSTTTAEIVAAG